MTERVVGIEGPLVFARNFFKNPKMLGSVIPSSRFLVDQLLRRVDWQQARVIVEFGPGVGTISREILRRMRPDATLVALEINDEFVRVLRRNFDDPRFRVVHRSAADVTEVLRELGLGSADAVIAGIPFSILPPELRSGVVRGAFDSLRAGGSMLVYQFSTRVRADLRRFFGTVRTNFEPRNIPPAHVFHCIKE